NIQATSTQGINFNDSTPTRRFTVNANGATVGGQLLPDVAGARPIGTNALPFSNIVLGTAATNNFNINPAATTAARTINILDFGAFGLATQQFPATVVLHSAYTNATTTFSTLGDGTRTVSFPVAANVDYTISCKLVYQASATTAGPKIQ